VINANDITEGKYLPAEEGKLGPAILFKGNLG
jgi:hypothetical protein